MRQSNWSAISVLEVSEFDGIHDVNCEFLVVALEFQNFEVRARAVPYNTMAFEPPDQNGRDLAEFGSRVQMVSSKPIVLVPVVQHSWPRVHQ